MRAQLTPEPSANAATGTHQRQMNANVRRTTLHEQDRAILKSSGQRGVGRRPRFRRRDRNPRGASSSLRSQPSEEAAEIREYAKTPRTLADIPLTELSADDRRILLQHAVLLTFIDGEQAPQEKALLTELCDKLRIPADEAKSLLGAAEGRAKRFLDFSDVGP